MKPPFRMLVGWSALSGFASVSSVTGVAGRIKFINSAIGIVSRFFGAMES